MHRAQRTGLALNSNAFTTGAPSTAHDPIIGGWPRRAIDTPAGQYGLFVVAVCLAFSPSLHSMTTTWASSGAALHGAFAAPTAFFLARGQYDAPGPAGLQRRTADPVAGLAALLVGAALWLAGRAAGINTIDQAAFVTVLIAGFVLTHGLSRARVLAAPLFFLYFMVPVGDSLLPPLQRLTTDAAAAGLALSGVSFERSGALITTSAGAFAITEACAGARLLTASAMAGFFIAFVSLRTNAGRATLFITALAAGLIANWLRVLSVILIATIADDAQGIGADHFIAGAIAFVLVLLGLLALAPVIARREGAGPDMRSQTVAARRSSSTGRAGGLTAGFAAGLAIIAASGLYAALVIDRTNRLDAAVPDALPALMLEGWRRENWRHEGAPPASAPDLSHADRQRRDIYAKGGARVLVSLGYLASDRPGAEAAGYETARAANRTTSATRYWLGDRVYDTAAGYKVALAGRRLRGAPTPAGVIIVSAYGEGVGADDAVYEALAAIEPLTDWRRRFPQTAE